MPNLNDAFVKLLSKSGLAYAEFERRSKMMRSNISAYRSGAKTIGTLALSKLDWRSPVRPFQANAPLKYAPKGYTWEHWSPAAVHSAHDAGRVIIVDFTAWWCGTCNVTVKPSLSSPEVVAKLKELNAVALLADNSDTPPEIVNELARYGRAGVPMVLVYPAHAKMPSSYPIRFHRSRGSMFL